MNKKTFAFTPLLAAGLSGASLARSNQDKDATPSEVLRPLTRLPTYASLISAYYNADVYDQKGKKVGEVTDMLVDKHGEITAVMLSVGGFLGIGEKDVAVPIDAIRVSQPNDKWWLTITADKALLKEALGYKYDRETAQWKPLTQ